MNKFGKLLVTRQDAKNALQLIDNKGPSLTLNFAGVKVANHSFADELGKGLAMSFNLSHVKLTGANQYVKNCLHAGFLTAVAS